MMVFVVSVGFFQFTEIQPQKSQSVNDFVVG